VAPEAVVVVDEAPKAADVAPAEKRSEASPERSGGEPSRSPKAEPSQPPSQQMPVPHAASADNVDVAMLRRSWPSLIDHLGQLRQPILRAILESATVARYEDGVLELAFPPDKRFGVQKVEDRQDDLQQALQDLFGIRPRIACVVRESREPAGGPSAVEIVEEEETPDEAEALRRVQEMLGATPLEGD